MNTHTYTHGGACKGLLCVIRSRLAAVVYCSLEQCVPAVPHCIQAELLEMCCAPVRVCMRVCVMLYYVQVYLHLRKLIWAYVSSDVEERQERGICILSVCVCIRVWLGHHVAEHVFTLLWECVCFRVCICFQIIHSDPCRVCYYDTVDNPTVKKVQTVVVQMIQLIRILKVPLNWNFELPILFAVMSV